MNVLDNDDSDVSEGSPVKLGIDPKIDWFHFETRMRNLIQEMLEPSVRRNVDTSDTIKKLEEMYEDIKYKQHDQDYKI